MMILFDTKAYIDCYIPQSQLLYEHYYMLASDLNYEYSKQQISYVFIVSDDVTIHRISRKI